MLGPIDQLSLLSYFQNYTRLKFSQRVTFVQQFNLKPATLTFNKKNNERLLFGQKEYLLKVVKDAKLAAFLSDYK
jgi:hypothetical protein